MDELIKLVAQKANISPAAAKTAVETVIGFLKTKLPAPIASQLDAVLAGQAGNLAQGLGAVLGQAKKT
jgi:hypothetical protein